MVMNIPLVWMIVLTLTLLLCKHTLAHPLNSPPQPTLSTHPHNLPSTHPLNPPSTHPLDILFQLTLSTHLLTLSLFFTKGNGHMDIVVEPACLPLPTARYMMCSIIKTIVITVCDRQHRNRYKFISSISYCVSLFYM